MGRGRYKGGSKDYRAFGDNAALLKANFQFNEKTGYFGTHGQKGQTTTRNIVSADSLKTAAQFYDLAAYGGIEASLPNGKGLFTKMKDGTVITFRQTSTSDKSPAVDLNISHPSAEAGGIKTQKIHFVQEETT